MAVYSRLLKVRSPLMSGEDVRAVQNKLNSLGYNSGTADGYYGDNTRNGVKRFQSARGLSADGIVGPDTWNKLFSSTSSGGSSNSSNYSSNPGYHRLLKVSSPLMRGEDVRVVQNKLNSLGYNAGTADGYYGDNTRNGVKRFQNARGLSADGIVGPDTWNKLFSSTSSGGSSNSSNYSSNSGYHRLLKVSSPLMRGEDVRVVQNKLNSMGFNVGKADGYYGDDTKNGVKRFQSARGLSADGIVGPSTWEKLMSGLNYVDVTSTIRSLCKKYERNYKNKYSRLTTPGKLYVFYNLVHNGGECDLKNQGFNRSSYIFDGRVVRGDALGNILYGYVGKAFGFSDQLLLRAAGFAQSRAGTNRPEWGHWYGSEPYGDDPIDQSNIKKGFSCYRKEH